MFQWRKTNSIESWKRSFLFPLTLVPFSSLVFCFCITSIIFSLSITLHAQSESIEQLEAGLKDLYGLEKLKALNKLSEAYLNEKSRKALRYGKEAVEIGENIFTGLDNELLKKDGILLIIAYYQLGKIYFERESYFDCREQMRKAKRFSKRMRNKQYLEDINRYLDRIQDLEDAGEIKETFFSKTFKDIDVGKVFDEATTDISINTTIRSGQNKEKRGDFEGAIEEYKKAINLLKNEGDYERIGELRLKIALLLDSLDFYQEAVTFLDEVIMEAEEVESKKDSFKTPDKELEEQIEKKNLKSQKKNLKDLAESYAREKDFEKSLEYLKKYQELSEKMEADSIRSLEARKKTTSEILLLKQQKQIANLNLEKQVRWRNTILAISLLLLGGILSTLYFYFSKRKQHKELTQAYLNLGKTKLKLEKAERRIKTLLSQQVSGDIAAELLVDNSNQPSERRFVCIMFLDIRDFTPMAEKLSPEELNAFQNKVFGFMIDIVHKHHGNINQLLGDGFMATFGAPVSHDNDCQNAFLAAKEILEVLKKRNEKEAKKLRVGMGLHAGNVVTGNVGNDVRKQYSVTGNPVIIAARVEQLNKQFKTQMIITEEVFKQIDNPLNLKPDFEEVMVKGRSKPVKIWLVE